MKHSHILTILWMKCDYYDKQLKVDFKYSVHLHNQHFKFSHHHLMMFESILYTQYIRFSSLKIQFEYQIYSRVPYKNNDFLR